MLLDTSAVDSWLRDRGWPLASADTVERIGHGEWSQAFAFTSCDAASYVVRFSATDADFRKDLFAAELGADAVPMPRVQEVGPAAPLAAFFAIAPRASGVYLDELSGAQMERALPSLFGAIDAMRQVDVSRTGGFGLWDASGSAPHAAWRDALLACADDVPGSRMAGWRAALERSPTGSATFDRALARLDERSTALPNARHLLHADLLNFNVLVRAERISAVLDWGSAMYGDWLFDVAWLAFWQPWYPAWRDLDFAAAAERYFRSVGADLRDFQTRLQCCELAIGMDNMAYCAWRGEKRWAQLAEVAARTLRFTA